LRIAQTILNNAPERIIGCTELFLTGKVVFYKMDQLDRDLIRILQKDAKKPFTQIAEELEQPDTTIHFRAKRLKENKTVTRFCALVRPEALGFTKSALLTIEIGGHILPEISKNRTQTFAAELSNEDQYLWIAVDDEPMIIHAVIMGENEQDLNQRVETIRKSPDVVKVTMNSMSAVVKGWEISGNPEERDD
jgi:DNA-binding Lrp family transcriptional regulator